MAHFAISFIHYISLVLLLLLPTLHTQYPTAVLDPDNLALDGIFVDDGTDGQWSEILHKDEISTTDMPMNKVIWSIRPEYSDGFIMGLHIDPFTEWDIDPLFGISNPYTIRIEVDGTITESLENELIFSFTTFDESIDKFTFWSFLVDMSNTRNNSVYPQCHNSSLIEADIVSEMNKGGDTRKIKATLKNNWYEKITTIGNVFDNEWNLVFDIHYIPYYHKIIFKYTKKTNGIDFNSAQQCVFNNVNTTGNFSMYMTTDPISNPVQIPFSIKQIQVKFDIVTDSPTNDPTKTPTKSPSKTPTKYPTKYPSKFPTENPSKSPTKNPSKYPTNYPSNNPTINPTIYNVQPTVIPTTTMPTTISPTTMQTNHPTETSHLMTQSAAISDTIILETDEIGNINDGGKSSNGNSFGNGLFIPLIIVVLAIMLFLILCVLIKLSRGRNKLRGHESRFDFDFEIQKIKNDNYIHKSVNIGDISPSSHKSVELEQEVTSKNILMNNYDSTSFEGPNTFGDNSSDLIVETPRNIIDKNVNDIDVDNIKYDKNDNMIISQSNETDGAPINITEIENNDKNKLKKLSQVKRLNSNAEGQNANNENTLEEGDIII